MSASNTTGTPGSGTPGSGTPGSGTPGSGTPPMPKPSEARAAVYGLLGAIIGGLATFAGAYWTGHQTISLAESTSARAACVEFADATSQFLVDLDRISDSLNEGGNSYTQTRTTALAEVPLLYRDGDEVLLYNNPTVGGEASRLASTLVSGYLPTDPKQLNANALVAVRLSAKNQFAKFEQDAAIELNPNYARFRRSLSSTFINAI
jgi:hypothetical protein